MDFTMFERLQQLPLFQGLTIKELSEIIEWMKLDFNQVAEGTRIVSQGDKCNSLIYIISGIVCSTLSAHDNKIVLTETHDTPFVLEPYNLYGMNQNYECSYSMHTNGSTLVIKKNIVNLLMMKYQIIRTNMLNITCSRLQRVVNENRDFITQSIREKIFRVVCALSSTKKSPKHIKVKMEDLADMIGETRLNVSKELNSMKNEGIAKIKRGEIIIENINDLKCK